MSHAEPPDPREADVEARAIADAISRLLVVGVGLSAAILLVGWLLAARAGYIGESEAWRVAGPGNLAELARGLARLDPLAVIMLGVVVLVATPVLRVATSVALFLHERDWTFVALTLAVLAILVASLFGMV